MISKIKKRDGRIVDFEQEKITNAIFKAAEAVGGEDRDLAKKLSDQVVKTLEEKFAGKTPTVEDVQDIVEKVLIESGHAKTAKAYIIYRKERSKIREAKDLLGVKDDLKLSINTVKVLKARYLLKDEEGNVIESTSELFRRVARHIAIVDILYHDLVFDKDRKQTAKELPVIEDVPKKAKDLGLNKYNVEMLFRAYERMNKRGYMKVTFNEMLEILRNKWSEIKQKEDEFYSMLSTFEFTPNSPTLMNAGSPLGQLSGCFVLPVNDSIESIFNTLKYTALVHQTGGGTGFSFSKLRYNGDIVKTTKGVASGPISFMRVFDVATDVIKQGGCISAGSLVRTDKGVVPISRLLNCPMFGDNPTKHLVYTNGEFENAFLAEDNGVAEVYNIKTKIGTSIKSTYNHQICVVDEDGKFSWKEAEKIKRGNWIVHVLGGHHSDDINLPKLDKKQHFNANKIELPKKISPDLAELLGIYMADGCISTGGRIIFAVENSDIQLKNRIKELMHKIFNLKLGMEQYKINDNSVCLIFYSRDVCNFFEKCEWKKSGALEAFVPTHVFESSENSARAFLRGLFEGDGDVHIDGYPRLYSASKKLMSDVQQLLFGLNMVSTVHKYQSKNRFGKNPVYHLCIIQQRSVDEFIKTIGFISDRKNEKLKSRQKDKFTEPVDVIPNQTKLLRKIYNGPGRGCGKNRSKLGANRKLYRDLQHYLISGNSSRNLTRKRLKELLKKHKELHNPELLKIADDQYFYSQVSEITKEKDYTMDIMVPTAEHFVANSILVHNKRRGANMGILRVDHPDILDFITTKDSENRVLTNFNISVAATDKFMDAVEKNKEFELLNPRNGTVVKKIFARQLWEMIIYQAWKTGDPGMIFIDELNRYNPTPHIGELESTNPCGEQPLLSYESCNLGSLNLSKMLKRSNGKAEIDWEKFRETVKKSVYFLDNVVDANRYPLQQIEFMTLANRKIGLGVMGWAEMLIELGIKYDSEKALKLAEEVMKFVDDVGKETSVEIAKSRGSFPNFKGSAWDKKGYKHMRNATVTTIAPTGTISIIANTSSGIEPLFAVAFVRRHVLSEGEELVDVNPLFRKIAVKEGFYTEELMREVSKTGSVKQIEEVPENVKKIFITAHDIEPEWHIKMQAAFQKYTDNAVSKTINLSNDAGINDVEKAYMLAYKLKCKGITIYRDMSKVVQVIHIGEKDKERKIPIKLRDEEKKEELKESEESCPVCKSKLYFAEGCFTCMSCGYSRCG